MNRYRTAAVVALTLLGAPALANETDGRGTVWSWLGDWDPSFYAGVGVHQGDYSDWSTIGGIDSQTYTSRSSDEADTGFRVSGGMKFLDNFAVEATYADFGGASFAGDSDGSGVIWEPGTQREELELSGIGLHLAGRFGVTSQFFVAARVGAWSLRSERHQTGTFDDAGTPTPFDIRDSSNSTQFGYGVALEYDGLAPVRVALEYDLTALDGQLGFDEGELSSIGLSLKYLFTGATR